MDIRHLSRSLVGTLALTALLAGCIEKSQDDPTPLPPAEGRSDALPTPEAPGGSDAQAASAVTRQTEPSGFSLESVEISNVPLGDFPYLQLPSGYKASSAFTKAYAFDRIGMWTGDRIEWIEGRFHVSHIRSDGGNYSPIELERNIAAAVEVLGGVRVFSGVEPAEVRAEIAAGTQSFQTRYRNGVCFPHDPVHVYVIRRSDRAIWLRQCSNGDRHGGWIIGETEAFEANVNLLPRSEIETALESTGRIAIQVNFASDQAEVLPDSMPQIEEIAALLEDNQALRLAIEGHTDDTGSADRNRVLARDRAQAVVDLVVARGIDADRLEAAGFGPDRPVADNSTELGKAENRRVELVALQ